MSEGATGDRPRKRSLTIAGHRTSVSLEDPFWTALKQIARQERRSLVDILAEIDAGRSGAGLSSAARVYTLTYFMRSAGVG